ncbi:MAG TPA: lamin tail domain-containing protein, partial [Verrucomicrobiae bacterium]|nr:lamin tail domain-containing protein [Verrucomicrobiae bacterium]
SPANGATFNAPVQFNLTAAASDGDGIVSRVEFYDGIILLGTDTASPFSIGVSNLFEGIHTLTAVAVDNSGASATSSPVSITVIDPNPPTLVAASATTNKVTVSFSKTVLAPSATTPGNYTITPSIGVQSVEFGSSPSIVVLTTTTTLTAGVNYTLTVNNVQGSGAIPIAPNSQIGFQVVGFTAADIGNPTLPGSTVPVSGGVDVTGAGTDIFGTTDQFQFSYESDARVGDFDVRVRVAGLNGADVWSKAGLMARETLTGGSRYAGVFSTPNIGGTYFQYRLNTSGGTTNIGGAPSSYPNTWLRLKRAGNVFSGYISMDGNAWSTLGSFTIPMANSAYIGLAVTSRDSTKTATAQFREFSNVSGGTIGGLVFDREPLGPSSRRSGLVISEIMYHPKTTNLHEYIEIFNSNPFFEDLSGYSISGAIDYTFPPGTVIQGGSFLVLARNPSAFQTLYGMSALGPWVGATTNGLPGEGGRVRLRSEARATLIDVDYGTRAPWPVAPDGTGHSLVLARPSYGEADPRAWAASDTMGGSPGRIEPASADPLRNVVINEFLAHTDEPQQDYIELYNHGNQAVDLSGAYLSDDPSTNKFRIPNGTTIPPRGFLSLVANSNTVGFALSSTGERLFLINSNQTRVIDAIDFDAQQNGVSTGRWPDGAPDFYRLATLSPGAANGAIRSEAVVINEIMYSPISGDTDDEYVELYNRSGSPVNIGRWRFVDGIDFTFPSTTVIPANGYLVVAKNLARLLANYPNLNTNNTVGSYDGTLANGG